jgi:DNA-binding MarR family transcriptional regulator
MPPQITTADYRALAALRYRIRLFIGEADDAARRVGLDPQQYFLLLAVRGLPSGVEATIQTLAERLALKHNSTVELIDRLEAHGYVCRTRSREDRRSVIVSLRPLGEKVLEQVAQQRITELRAGGMALVEAIGALLGNPRWPKKRPRPQRNASQQKRERGGQS